MISRILPILLRTGRMENANFLSKIAPTKTRSVSTNHRQHLEAPKILQRELDPGLEILEYYEVEEEGVDVPMEVPQKEYLRTDIEKRPISQLTPDELMDVLRDQKAKDIVCIQSNENGEEEVENSTNFPFSTILCSPYNQRHAKALDSVVRAFVKRNFYFQNWSKPPCRSRAEERKTRRGWYTLDLSTIVLHIMDQETRKRYDFESLLHGEEEEEETSNGGCWWRGTNDAFIVQPEEKQPVNELNEEKLAEEKPRRLRGSKSDPFIPPHY